MLLQRFAEYAEQMGDDRPPPMYQRQPIRYVIRLDRDGRPRGQPVDTVDPTNPRTRKGVERFAPHVKRVGVKPKLLADTAAYVLGIGTESAPPGPVADKREAFTALVADCAVTTDESAVAAVHRFLTSSDRDQLPLPDKFDPGATMTFQVDGSFPIDLPSVQAYWANRFVAADSEGAEAAYELPCVICGRRRPPEQRHPVKIKGLRGGQPAGTDLISADKRAFESYGLENSLIAPTCLECAEKYANGLNALLADKATSLGVGTLMFVFWTAARIGFNAVGFLSVENAGEVKELLAAYRSGRVGALDVDETAFYAASLSANGGRAVVRSWLTTTVGEAKRRLAAYFATQELVMSNGDPSEPVPIWQLTMSTVRRGGSEQPAPAVAEGLVALALKGTPLPSEVLFQAVRRCRADQEVTRNRAMLIKMALESRRTVRGGDRAMRELDLANQNPAYVCGRVLAILDAIQQRALGSPNATLVDKFYGSASSAPASVYGTLLHNAQNHLAKMRKSPQTQPAQRALESRLTETLALLDEFPTTLTLPDQGLFALGYYHQRAEDRRQARRRAEERGKALAAEDDLVLDADEIADDLERQTS